MKFKAFDTIMREYEEALDQKIPTGIWPVVRLDGRSFTKLVEKLNLERPFDEIFRDAMITATKDVMGSGFQAIYAYIESDEISILFSKKDHTFNRKIRKWLSALAGEASASFTHAIGSPGAFDARICLFPSMEIIFDYFRWRQSDCRRNSLICYCYWLLRQSGDSGKVAGKKLEHMSLEEKILLLRSYGLNYKEIPNWQRNGIAIKWKEIEKEGYNPKRKEKVIVKRRVLSSDFELPIGDSYQTFVEKLISDYKI